jgi:NitT/TauT family transport system permease protein
MQETLFPATTLPQRRQHHWRKFSLRRMMPLLTLLLLILFWQTIYALNIYPAFIIPAPTDVVDKFVEVLADGTLALHTWTTLQQVFPGLALGLISGISLGYIVAKSRLLEDALSPIIVAFQATPIVAYAPLLVIWFGGGATSKIITSALIVFFPMLMNTIVGIRNVPLPLREVMRLLNASGWQTFIKLEVPAAMPVLISGLKVSSTLAVIGAVVGEFVSASAGLGFLVTVARQQYDTPLVIVSVFTLTLMALSLYNLVGLLERRVLAWEKRAQHSTQ